MSFCTFMKHNKTLNIKKTLINVMIVVVVDYHGIVRKNYKRIISAV